MKKLEVACFMAEDAKFALECGAHRIEFCTDYEAGGLTPDLDEFILLRSQFPDAKIHVMIRPRDGDFVYSNYKIQIMQAQIEAFGFAGADGFVFGVLNSDQTINEVSCRELIHTAKVSGDKKLIFHRAFDLVPNAEQALEQLINLGFTGVLCSGAAKNAMDGRNNLKTWVEITQNRLEIIVGGGVRSHNVERLFDTDAMWFHSAAWDKNRFSADELSNLLAALKSHTN